MSKEEKRRCEDEAICTANEKSVHRFMNIPTCQRQRWAPFSWPAISAPWQGKNGNSKPAGSTISILGMQDAARVAPKLDCVRPTDWEFMTMRQNDLQCLIDTGTQHVKPCLGRRNASFLIEAIDLQSPRQSGCRP